MKKKIDCINWSYILRRFLIANHAKNKFEHNMSSLFKDKHGKFIWENGNYISILLDKFAYGKPSNLHLSCLVGEGIGLDTFTWGKSPEGGKYWSYLSQKWKREIRQILNNDYETDFIL